jgi:hypothetical protein
MMMFQYLQSSASKEILDSVSSMSPCTVMKEDGVRCQQASSLSLECQTQMITECIARDTSQHRRGDYSCCRAVTTGHQRKLMCWWHMTLSTNLSQGGKHGRGRERLCWRNVSVLLQVIKSFQNYRGVVTFIQPLYFLLFYRTPCVQCISGTTELHTSAPFYRRLNSSSFRASCVHYMLYRPMVWPLSSTFCKSLNMGLLGFLSLSRQALICAMYRALFQLLAVSDLRAYRITHHKSLPETPKICSLNSAS